MIKKAFLITDEDYEYYIGITKIKLESKMYLDDLFNYITEFNAKNALVTQFFDENYVLNQDHVFNACYFVQKAFRYNINISKNTYIEFFLYLAANRQIKVSIDSFGITDDLIETGKLPLCLLSRENNLTETLQMILDNLNAKETDININQRSMEKFERIKTFFEISDIHLKSILDSNEIQLNQYFLKNLELKSLFNLLNDLICEKMSLLSLEKK